ncbi:hypothetical protein SVIOM74S_01980 [Streptomyces violarus]
MPWSCLTMPKRPASRPMATCTVIGMPSSRARAHSEATTSLTQKPGPRVARAMVSRPSSDAKCRARIRRTSSAGIAILLSNQ